ncbi:hypothetical protein PG987_006421 [Apiospora arundinis]
MRRLMDCVKKDHYNKDKKICRSRDPEDEEGFDAWLTPFNANEACLYPREVLIYKSKDFCPGCRLTGALRSCPRHDPQFLNCLCEQGAQPHHFQCFAQCFRIDDSGIDAAFFCQNLRQRDELIDAESDTTTTKAVERQAQPTSYPPVTFNKAPRQLQTLPLLSHYYRVTNARSHTALLVCTVDPTMPVKSCRYIKTQAAVPTISDHYIHPSEPTGLSYKSQVTMEP